MSCPNESWRAKNKQTNIKQTNKQSICWKLIIIINFILRIKEQGTHLILPEHDDDDDDDIHTWLKPQAILLSFGLINTTRCPL
jgi:hypothetical protein